MCADACDCCRIVSPCKLPFTADENQIPIHCCMVPQTGGENLVDEDCIPLFKLAAGNNTASKDRPASSMSQTQPDSTDDNTARDSHPCEDDISFAQLIGAKHESGQAFDHVTAAFASCTYNR